MTTTRTSTTSTASLDPLKIPAALEARSLVFQRDQAATDEEREALAARIREHQMSTRWRYWPPAYRSARGSWTWPGSTTVRDRIWDDPRTAATTSTSKTTEREA